MITVLGSINMDLIAGVDRLPQSGETVSGHHFSTAAGGKGANQALAARRAGAEVRMFGAVGNDGFAEPALNLLTDAGTNLSDVRRVEEPTGTALIMVDQNGENIIAVVPGANGRLSSHDAEAAIGSMQQGDHLLLQMEIPPDAIRTALSTSRDRGVISLVNTAPMTAEAKDLAAMADIVVANETEFELLAGQSHASAADREAEMRSMHARTGQTLIVTLGAEGVIAARDGKVVRIGSLTIEPVDTVGAGDTFCGYLAAGLDAGLDFETALKRAAAAGSLACLKPGAQPAIPTGAEVDRALA